MKTNISSDSVLFKRKSLMKKFFFTVGKSEAYIAPIESFLSNRQKIGSNLKIKSAEANIGYVSIGGSVNPFVYIDIYSDTGPEFDSVYGNGLSEYINKKFISNSECNFGLGHTIFFYDFESYKRFSIRFPKVFNDKLDLKKEQETFKSLMSSAKTVDLIELHIINKSPILILLIQRNGFSSCEGLIEINANLNKFQFFKCLDPYSAFQNIEMFINGVASTPCNPPIEISDVDKRDSRGFDKMSFRKRPGLKKRRKK